LKKEKRFNWTEECEAAFQKFKETLSALPTLTKPDPREMLYLYLAIAEKAISVALVKDDNKSQKSCTL